MDDGLKTIMYGRAKIASNLDKIISSAKKSKSLHGQLSMFDTPSESDQVEVSLSEPEDFNPYAVAAKEEELLGYALSYSIFEEYEYVNCKFCNSNLYDLLQSAETGRKTILLRILEIESRISSYGNQYAKILFGDQTGSERLYLTGKIYRNMFSRCHVGEVYLLTIETRQDLSLEIVNMMMAKDALSRTNFTSVSIICNVAQIPSVRMYTKVFMMGDSETVIVYVSNGDDMIPVYSGKIKADRDNLVELRKMGVKVILK